MTVADPTPPAERDQLVAFLTTNLNKGIEEMRSLRATRLEQKGYIDSYRLLRDVAGGLLIKLSKRQLALLLAEATNRLAQMDDFNPAAEIAELDFETPEEEK